MSSPNFLTHGTITFPGKLGLIANALYRTPIDPALSAAIMMAFITLLTRGLAFALWPNGMTLPVGAHVVTLAGSGTGKSLLKRFLFDPFDAYIGSRVMASGKHPDFLFEDVTRESTIMALRDWPVRLLMVEEGSMVERLFKNIAALGTFAKLADSASLFHARIESGRIALKDYAFAMALFVQPDNWEWMKITFGKQSGGIGLHNRCFFVKGGWPLSQDDLERLVLPPEVMHLIEALIDEYVGECLLQVEQGLQHRSRKRLSPDALMYFKHQVATYRPYGLSQTSEYVSRHPERVLGLSGGMSVIVDGPASDISLECIESAARLGEASIATYGQMTYVPPTLTQAEQDALTLENAIRGIINSMGSPPKLKDLKKYAMNIGLTSARFNRALALLGQHGRVQVVIYEGDDLVIPNTRLLGRF